MEKIIGLIIIAIGSFGQSSSYVPIKKINAWHWESFWLVQGVFAWLVFPLMGANLGVGEGGNLMELWSDKHSLVVVGYGILWGVGGLTFGLSMRYLGVALGQSIALGTCSAFGTLLPALLVGTDLLSGQGLLLLIGVTITIVGIFIIGYAGSLRSKSMNEEERRAAIKDFALTKGLIVAILCGVMSACFAMGLEAGAPIKQMSLDAGVNSLYAGLPVVCLVTVGGFVTNAAYCLYQNAKNKSFSDYSLGRVWPKNICFCCLAGLLWYSQFFGLEVGKSFLIDSPILLAFSWSILMALNVMFSNIWGLILKEWHGASKSTIGVLILGLTVLILSIITVAVAQQ